MSDRRRRIIFLINSLEGGGAERAMANLLRYLEPDLAHFDVHLVLLDNLPEEQVIPSYVTKHVLDGRGSLVRSAVELSRFFLRLRPDLCLSYLARSNCLNVWGAGVFRYRSVISERVHTTSHLANARNGDMLRRITAATYKHADRVIAVSEGVAEDLACNYGVPRAKLLPIQNPIDAQRVSELSFAPFELDLPEAYILAMGRLVPNKNFEMLIRAYHAAAPDIGLVILGEGPERARLEALVRELGLSDRVRLPGFVRNPYPAVRAARFLASSSNAEGFPNTLVEALCLGCPVIATDCPSGPFEVLGGERQEIGRDPSRSARFGMLVPPRDVGSMAAAIAEMVKPPIRAHFHDQALVRAKSYDVESVTSSYMAVIGELLGNRRKPLPVRSEMEAG